MSRTNIRQFNSRYMHQRSEFHPTAPKCYCRHVKKQNKKNMSVGSVKSSICPFYLLLPFFFLSYLVFINIKSCYVSVSFKKYTSHSYTNILIYLIYAFWDNTITITSIAVVKSINYVYLSRSL